MPEMSAARSGSLVSPELRILFIGNSLTYRGGGLDHHFRSIVPGAVTERVVKGGATLDQLLHLAGDRIAEAQWDIVVLQDDIPETTIGDFLAAAGKGIRLVREAGALPLLLMTWPYERLDWIDLPGIIEAHREAETGNNVEVVPAGKAWAASRRERPDLELYDKDREHPSEIGSFLAACTLAATLDKLKVYAGQRSSPCPDNIPAGLNSEDAIFLIDMALSTAGNWY